MQPILWDCMVAIPGKNRIFARDATECIQYNRTSEWNWVAIITFTHSDAFIMLQMCSKGFLMIIKKKCDMIGRVCVSFSAKSCPILILTIWSDIYFVFRSITMIQVMYFLLKPEVGSESRFYDVLIHPKVTLYRSITQINIYWIKSDTWYLVGHCFWRDSLHLDAPDCHKH